MSEKFNKLIREAKKAAIEYKEHEKPAKLSAKAFLRDAMETAKTDVTRLKELRKTIESESSFRSSRAFMRNAVKWLRETSCPHPTSELRRLTWLGDINTVMSELATVQSSVLELFALAVLIASERYPEAFGNIENWKEHIASSEKAKVKRDSLYQKISTEFGPEDLRIGSVGSDGRALISFAASNGEVPLAPVENAGERLVEWLLRH